MFEILGEDKDLFQWDVNRKLSVPDGISEVHFSNTKSGISKRNPVINGEVVIRPEVLRIYGTLFVWGWYDGNTKIERKFTVLQRPKPDDYVYTPEEVKTWDDLRNKIGNLDSLKTNEKKTLVDAINELFERGEIDPETAAKAVEKYLEAHPVKSPVDSVNGKTGAVNLTAKDVGALSQDELQSGVNKALQQAKESGEFKGDNGYTPIKGKDYFTEAEINEIAQMAFNLIPIYEGEVESV